MRDQLKKHSNPEYTNVITELGICYSTSYLYYLQNPIPMNQMEYFPIKSNKTYLSTSVGREVIVPHSLDSKNVTVVSKRGAF